MSLLTVIDQLTRDKKISWTRALKNDLAKNKRIGIR